MNLKEVEKVQWWLMYCDRPNLNWARLQVYDDGSADVFDMDGRTTNFPTEKEARLFLKDDEFTELNMLDEEDEGKLGLNLALLKPPMGHSDKEMLPNMYVKDELD